MFISVLATVFINRHGNVDEVRDHYTSGSASEHASSCKVFTAKHTCTKSVFIDLHVVDYFLFFSHSYTTFAEYFNQCD
jgi:hypothetical protein